MSYAVGSLKVNVSALKRLTELLLITARRYDVLFTKHVEMYLTKESERNKKALSLAFVEKTINEIVTMLNDESLKNDLAEYICISTERVITKCDEENITSLDAMRRLHFSYMFCVNCIPNSWRQVVGSLENIFYRDMTRVYDRYMVLKTIMTDTFKTVSDTILQTVFETEHSTVKEKQ